MAAAVVLCIGVPFFLPHMHERYFFLADMFTLCWACADRRRAPAAVLVCGSSLASYCVYLRLKYNCVVRLGGGVFVMGRRLPCWRPWLWPCGRWRSGYGI